MTRALHLLILYALTHIPSRPTCLALLHILGTHHPPHRRRLTINPVLATHIIRANLIGKLAVLHSQTTSQDGTARCSNNRVEQHRSICQEVVGPFVPGSDPSISHVNSSLSARVQGTLLTPKPKLTIVR